MSTVTYAYTGTLVVIDCHKCHVTFGMPDDLYARAQKNPSITFYCPNGHNAHFPGKTEAQRLRDELEAEQRRVVQERSWRRQAEDEAARERRSAAAQKGHATRLRRRAAAGVCPCCKRSFVQLKRHMDGQHPEFVEAVKP